MFVQGEWSAWKRSIEGTASSWFGTHAGKSIVRQDVGTETVPDNNLSLRTEISKYSQLENNGFTIS